MGQKIFCKRSAFLLFLLSSVCASSFGFAGSHDSVVVRKNSREIQKEYCKAYLETYDNADLSVDSESILYSSSVPVSKLSRIDNLSESNDDENGNVTFDVTYLALLNKVFITASLYDDEGNKTDSIFVSGDAFISPDTERPEVKYDFAGQSFLASDIVDPTIIEPSSLRNVNLLELGGGGGGGTPCLLLSRSSKFLCQWPISTRRSQLLPQLIRVPRF